MKSENQIERTEIIIRRQKIHLQEKRITILGGKQEERKDGKEVLQEKWTRNLSFYSTGSIVQTPSTKKGGKRKEKQKEVEIRKLHGNIWPVIFFPFLFFREDYLFAREIVSMPKRHNLTFIFSNFGPNFFSMSLGHFHVAM